MAGLEGSRKPRSFIWGRLLESFMAGVISVGVGAPVTARSFPETSAEHPPNGQFWCEVQPVV